jgi:hypothetical protein
MDKTEDAKEVALKALKRHPNNASLSFSLGCYCSLLGETKEASEHVKKAAGLDKTLPKASVDHPDLDNLWKSIASIFSILPPKSQSKLVELAGLLMTNRS